MRAAGLLALAAAVGASRGRASATPARTCACALSQDRLSDLEHAYGQLLDASLEKQLSLGEVASLEKSGGTVCTKSCDNSCDSHCTHKRPDGTHTGCKASCDGSCDEGCKPTPVSKPVASTHAHAPSSSPPHAHAASPSASSHAHAASPTPSPHARSHRQLSEADAHLLLEKGGTVSRDSANKRLHDVEAKYKASVSKLLEKEKAAEHETKVLEDKLRAQAAQTSALSKANAKLAASASNTDALEADLAAKRSAYAKLKEEMKDIQKSMSKICACEAALLASVDDALLSNDLGASRGGTLDPSAVLVIGAALGSSLGVVRAALDGGGRRDVKAMPVPSAPSARLPDIHLGPCSRDVASARPPWSHRSAPQAAFLFARRRRSQSLRAQPAGDLL